MLEGGHLRVKRVIINNNDEIFVEDNIVALSDLKEVAKAFLDNNGDASCVYCNGKKDAKSSDNPNEAIISLQNGKLTSYEMYVAVQDILTQAYYELREDYAKSVLGKSANKLTEAELIKVKDAYPFLISEAETK